MQAINEVLQQEVKELVETLILTKPNEVQEEYILTEEEEKAVMENEVVSLKKYYAWKLANYGLSEMEVLSRLAQIDFESAINREQTLKRANSNKLYDRWQKAQREKEKKEAALKQEEVKSFWTAKNLYNLMAWTSEKVYGKKLIVNDNTTPLIKAICFFLSEDERFESELEFSHSKGLLIRGVSGLGKTHLVKCVEANELNPVLIQSMIEITDQVKAEGEYSLNMAGRKVLYLDDVGTEESPVKHYGTNVNWFKDFLEIYYSKGKPFRNLMISTNLSFQQIEDKYGFRVRSRMKDLFNVVDVTGKDLRG